MSSLYLKIIKPGMLCSLQDDGRYGFTDRGVPMSGAFDNRAMGTANWILGNIWNNPVIEISGPGVAFRFSGHGYIAVTGAIGDWTLNGSKIASYESIEITTDSILKLGKLTNGFRSYIAISGNISKAPWLDSISPIRVGNSVFPNQAILTKDIELEWQSASKIFLKKFPLEGIPSLSNLGVVRIVAGPEHTWFSKDQIDLFLQQEFTISTTSNRMGLRLDGQELLMDGMPEMISSGILPGTIQINAQGLPMVLGSDAQTMGGYPRIAVVISADYYKIAQLQPKSKIWFKLVSYDQANRLRDYQEKRLRHFLGEG